MIYGIKGRTMIWLRLHPSPSPNPTNHSSDSLLTRLLRRRLLRRTCGFGLGKFLGLLRHEQAEAIDVLADLHLVAIQQKLPLVGRQPLAVDGRAVRAAQVGQIGSRVV